MDETTCYTDADLTFEKDLFAGLLSLEAKAKMTRLKPPISSRWESYCFIESGLFKAI